MQVVTFLNRRINKIKRNRDKHRVLGNVYIMV